MTDPTTVATVAPTTNHSDYEMPKNFHILEGIWMFLFVYVFVVAIATVVVNSLTLYAIYKDPLKCFRNPLAVFVTGVLVADLVTGLIGEPVIVAGISHAWRTGETVGFRVLIVGFVVFAASTTVSFLTLLALAICQLLAIGWAQRYERCVSYRSAKIGIGVIWTITIILCLLTIVTVWLVIGVMLFEVTLITIALVIIYIVSYHVFRKRVNRQENLVVTKEFMKGTFLLVLVQLLTVWPYIACSIAAIFYYATPQSRYGWVNLEIVRAIANILFLTKFAADPIILVWRIPKYKKSLKIVYAGCLKCCGCAKDEKEGRAAYNETRREDFDEDSQDKVNVEVI
ncbi:adenosine receptor A3 [Exaiptasia diaphana]|uniref:G-protein coupled receptors family 1 profile domain-containing protein n=1 Tax=Exaiptasia diaphana TaxID=2652724 RepID=A0A913XQE4_EXADI|nr:adenosine receptor A3 [Exaiptasia diaphana]